MTTCRGWEQKYTCKLKSPILIFSALAHRHVSWLIHHCVQAFRSRQKVGLLLPYYVAMQIKHLNLSSCCHLNLFSFTSCTTHIIHIIFIAYFMHYCGTSTIACHPQNHLQRCTVHANSILWLTVPLVPSSVQKWLKLHTSSKRADEMLAFGVHFHN